MNKRNIKREKEEKHLERGSHRKRRMMAEREQETYLERFYSLKRGAQQGEVALIRALC